MKVTIEFNDLQRLIEDVAKKQTEETIDEAVREVIKGIVERDYKQTIESKVNELLESFVINYIDGYQMLIGGGGLGEEPVYKTPKEYINDKINHMFTTKTLTTTVKDSYYSSERTKEVTFEEFIRKEFDPTSTIERKMKEVAGDVRRQTDALIKKEYDKALSNALSATIVDVIMENDAFKSINSKIGRLSE